MFVHVFVCVTKHACGVLKFRVKKKFYFLNPSVIYPLYQKRVCVITILARFSGDSIRFVSSNHTRPIFAKGSDNFYFRLLRRRFI